MKFGLPAETLARMEAVFKAYPEIEEVVIYGSRAKGTYRPGSDIDITLKGNAISSETLPKVITAIDDLNTPYLVDLSVFHQLHSPDLEEHIKRVGKVFYKRDEQTVASR